MVRENRASIDPRQLAQGNPRARAGFIGIGRMGRAISRCAHAAGHPVAAYDVDPSALQELEGLAPTAVTASNPAQVARESDLLAVVVNDDAQVLDSVLGPQGVLDGARPGLVVLIHSTVSVETVLRVAAEAEPRGVVVLDAGLSGANGEKSVGQLCVMVGGTEEAFRTAEPLLETYGDPVLHLGTLGAGMRAKLARNVTCYLSYLAIYEGLQLAERAGISRAHTDRIFDATGIASPNLDAYREMRHDLRAVDPVADPERAALVRLVTEMGRKDLTSAQAAAIALDGELELPGVAAAIQSMSGIFGDPVE